MRKPTLQTILVSVLIITALFTSIYFPYKWKQLSNDFLAQTNQYGELLKQINDLQKEVGELKNRDEEVEDLEDWKIYRNEEYGFEVKYPEEWNHNGGPLPYTFYFGKSGDIYDHQVGITIEENSSIEKFKDSYQNCEKTFVDNKEGLKCKGRSWVETEKGVEANYFVNYIYIGIESNGKFYFFSVFASDKSLDRIKNFNQMLSTFKFVEKDEISNWKIYRNEEYGFEVRYPKRANISKPKTSGFVFIGENPISGYGYGIGVDVIKNSENLSAEKWYSQYYEDIKEKSESFPLTLPSRGEHVQLNVYSAYKIVEFGYDHENIYFFISFNNYIYKIYYIYEPSDPDWDNHEEIINQILSTFKFIE